MSINNFTEFSLPKDSYVAFDATTLKRLIISRLNESKVFTDQIYEGSNINAFIDVVAYMYHVLLFYLNTTSSESTFTTAALYENINKLVSNLNYKPLGKQTSLVNISLSGAESLSPGNYIIGRFSSIDANGIPYTTISDISFEKTTNGAEELSVNNNILHQGVIFEHPLYSATGENFETITIVNNPETSVDARFIADNTFTVFVRDTLTSVWQQWRETSSLYLEDSNSFSYEKRLNENGNFELKFGNGINGRKLNETDAVQIYYVISDGNAGVVSANTLRGRYFNPYVSPIFNSISLYLYSTSDVLIAGNLLSRLATNNTNDSTAIAEAETVEQIKQNAPLLFSLQNRLVTSSDYEYFINRSFNNIVKSVKIINNDAYVSNVLGYYYSIGLNKPNEDCRVLFNQVNFSNSTTFNNVFAVMVPKNTTIINGQIPNYVNTAQKQLIINECNAKKDLTHNIVPLDAIYKAMSFGLQISNEQECVDLKDRTVLVIKKDPNVRVSSNVLNGKVVSIITDYFNNIQLGQIIDLTQISNDILNIEGITRIITRRTDTGYEVPRLSMVVWNPLYEEDDVTFTSQNVALQNFMYAYFYDINNISTKIIIENE